MTSGLLPGLPDDQLIALTVGELRGVVEAALHRGSQPPWEVDLALHEAIVEINAVRARLPVPKALGRGLIDGRR